MEKNLYPTRVIRCITNKSSECGKSLFLRNLILNTFDENDKIYIFSPSLHQDLYQKIYKCFNNYIQIHIITNILNEEDTDLVIGKKLRAKTLKNQTVK